MSERYGAGLVDMHCHLDFLSNPVAFAQAAAERGMAFFACTVAPQGFRAASDMLSGCDNVRVGVGLHPWWINDGRCGDEEIEHACRLANDMRYIGEVGLDFGKRCRGSSDMQLAAFEQVARVCAKKGGKLMSVHAVKSAYAVLDVLERTGCLAANQVIFHWFSDSSDALWRAVQSGCLFSVNARMLATRRGREYARVLPRGRLLLETDLPPEGEPGFALDSWEQDIRGSLRLLEEIRGESLEGTIADSSRSMLAAPNPVTAGLWA